MVKIIVILSLLWKTKLINYYKTEDSRTRRDRQRERETGEREREEAERGRDMPWLVVVTDRLDSINMNMHTAAHTAQQRALGP